MRHEPRGLVGDPKLAMQLMGADPLFARCHQVKAQDPLVEGNVALFHDRADRHGERLATGVAHVHAGAVGLAFDEGVSPTIPQ